MYNRIIKHEVREQKIEYSLVFFLFGVRRKYMEKKLFVFFRYVFAPISVLFAFFGLAYITITCQFVVIITVMLNIYKYQKDSSSKAKNISVFALDVIFIIVAILTENISIILPLITISIFLTLLTTEEVKMNKNWNTPFE
jgi:hypothetical protein